ncbi:MAG: hypothetical protein QCI38_05855, partial [Candidatus Thermoplasmatota archaeon]|nr:hypothetical protein [Candidatus Thermoplasmatota archaeon]
TVFCDGGKVQITPARKAKDLVETLRKRYEDGVVRDGAFVVSAEGAELVVFDDGRALVMGRDEEGAKRLYSSFVGW